MGAAKTTHYSRSEPILLPIYPRFILDSLRQRGYTDEDVLAGLNFTADDLNEESFRLTIEQHERFVLRAIEITEDPHLSIVLSKQHRSEPRNLTLMAVANSGQIAKALYLVARYFKILTRVFSIRTFTTEPDAVMHLDVHVEHELVRYFAVSSFALFLNYFFADVLSDANLVQRVELTGAPPPDFEAIQDRLPITMSFEQRAVRIYFDPALLNHSMQQADPKTVRLLLDMSEQQLQDAEAEMTLVGAVKAMLIEQIAAPPKMDQAARFLGFSSRTLRRKLEQSGTSYQQILDDIRLKMASQLIKETRTPIASIAYELGFANASDFGRAFKKWTGVSPTTLRHN